MPIRERPSKEMVAAMPVFEGLGLDRIHLLKNEAQLNAALAEIQAHGMVGFDTESKPTFRVGDLQDGPHVVQIALPDKAFIVQINEAAPMDFLSSVVESNAIVKIGFGLKSDRAPLTRKLGLHLDATVDLSHTLKTLGFKEALGIKIAVAVVFGQRMQKSHSVTTSNWAARELSPKQLLYAANDAYAALRIYEAMGSPEAAVQRLQPAPSSEPRPRG